MIEFVDDALGYIRSQLELWMLDEVAITRPSTEQTWDPETGITNPPTSTGVYTGKARIAPTRGPSDVAVGEEVFTWRDTDIYIPWDAPLPRSDDLIEITDAHDDPALVGRVFRVTTVRVGTLNVERKMSCTSLEPSSESPDAP